ncbi:hypothetical protein Ancab_002442 [Ancistrocladus abbreviatus]
MSAGTDREDRDNDESVSVLVGTAELTQEVTAMRVSSGKMEMHNGGKGFWVQGLPVFSDGCTIHDSSRRCGSEFQQKKLSGSFSNRKVKGNVEVRWCSNGKKICEGLLAHGDSGPEVERRWRLVGRLWVKELRAVWSLFLLSVSLGTLIPAPFQEAATAAVF